MAAQLLALQNIGLTFGGAPLLEGADLSVAPGDRIALVGRNGSGKSTLLKIAAGLIEPDTGERFAQPGATIRYLPQEPDLSGFSLVLDFVAAGLAPGDDPYRAQYLIDHLGLTGQENPAHLSGGEARRAALARVLAPQPDILLLDEPTNHLDLPAIEWLEAEVRGLSSALVLISHDRRFLSDLTKSTVWLDRGRARRHSRGFSGFEAWRDQVLEEEEAERHKLDRQIVREEHWVRYGVTARRKRNVRRMSELADMRQKRVDQRQRTGTVNLTVTETKSSGTIVVDAKAVNFAYEDRPIITDFTARILRGDRVGIVGPNGAGKTTLVDVLTGLTTPDTGAASLGSSLTIARLDQGRTGVAPETSLKDALTGGGGDNVVINGSARHVVSYMKDFLFTPEQAGTAISRLSGGERARVALARALSLPSNLLVLDEPTNDLDLETLDLLQELVADYPGTVILVSHDRDFLDRVATTIIASEGEGKWVEYAGGYSDMLRQRRSASDQDKALSSKKQNKAARQLPATGGSQKPKKLSFNHQHALKTIPGKLAKLTTEMDDLTKKLADPAFFNRDPAGFNRTSTTLATKQAEHESLENEWLELEILREELDNQG